MHNFGTVPTVDICCLQSHWLIDEWMIDWYGTYTHLEVCLLMSRFKCLKHFHCVMFILHQCFKYVECWLCIMQCWTFFSPWFRIWLNKRRNSYLSCSTFHAAFRDAIKAPWQHSIKKNAPWRKLTLCVPLNTYIWLALSAQIFAQKCLISLCIQYERNTQESKNAMKDDSMEFCIRSYKCLGRAATSALREGVLTRLGHS